LILQLAITRLINWNGAKRWNNWNDCNQLTRKWYERSISLGRFLNQPAQVYEFASNPENLPKWAEGSVARYKNSVRTGLAESPMGRVNVKFAEKNKLGVLDHDVTLPSRGKVYNPMRVFPNSDGSELVLTR
jgi:hypothetical protein